MLKFLQRKDTLVRVFLGFLLGVICLGMLLYLVPGQGGSTGSATDVVAEVGGEPITSLEVRQQLQRVTRRAAIPRALEALYIQQIVNQLLYQHMLELEARRLGIRVSDEERAERIRLLLPTALSGDAFVGMEQYAAEVQQRFDMVVPEFEELIRQGLLEEKIRRLVTDGINVTPEEVVEEFRRRNEKVTLEYVLVKPEEMESQVAISDRELAAYFEKNKERYVVPEKRVVRYALLEMNQIRQRANIPEEDLRAYYNQNIDRYRLQDRAHVSHILFKTIGKTDAEVEEIRKKAEDVLKKAKRGAKFEDLAKQFSEDTSKEKGGDLGWIVRHQTVAEFEKVAFGIPKGAVSDLVKTQYGFHIVKVLDREAARTQGLEEVRASILATLSNEKAERLASEQMDKISAAVRRSTRASLDDIVREFRLTVGETGPVGANDPLLELGNAPELRDTIFRLRPGELSTPIRTDRGAVVLTVKDVRPSHPGTLEEVKDKVTADLRGEKAAELAKARAEELAKRVQSGETLAAVSKALRFEAKMSEPFARTGSLSGVGTGRQLAAAFSLAVGQAGPPTLVGSNWLVYRVAAREEVKPQEFARQRGEITAQVLESKRQLAYGAFRSALEARLRREGKVKLNAEPLKRLTSPA